jgi:hypothetical protein
MIAVLPAWSDQNFRKLSTSAPAREWLRTYPTWHPENH